MSRGVETTPEGAPFARAALAQTTRVAVALIAPDGTVVGWNPGAVATLGYRAEEILGRPFEILFLPDDRASGRPRHELLEAETKGVAISDNWLQRNDGTPVYVSCICEPLEVGGVRAYVKLFRDATERRRLEEDAQRRAEGLAASNLHRERFLAMLSHELRNPMAPITHAVEALDRLMPQNERARDALGVIRRQSVQLSRIVDDLLDATRVASGKVRLVRERIDLRELAKRAAEAAHPGLQQRRHAFVLEVPPREVPVEVDPARIVQVLTNLLNNATKYTEPGGRIVLSVEAGESDALVRVVDNGVGIEPMLVPHVFDMFMQDDRHLHRAQGGLGIGLALAQSLATLHGGSVQASSEGPGRGATFELTLPLAPDAERASAGSAGGVADAATVDPSAISVLVVDDNMDGADSLALLLRLTGYDVRVAYDGRSAIADALSRPLDVVLLDLALPDIDGFAVLAELRAVLPMPQPIFVALTGFGDAEARRKVDAAGFEHHCLKPIEPAAIEALLATIGRELVR